MLILPFRRSKWPFSGLNLRYSGIVLLIVIKVSKESNLFNPEAGYSETLELINQTTRSQILEYDYPNFGIKIVLCCPQQLMHFICRMSSILRVRLRDILLSNEEIIFSFNKEFDIRVVGLLENSELIRTKSCSLWVMLLTGLMQHQEDKALFLLPLLFHISF